MFRRQCVAVATAVSLLVGGAAVAPTAAVAAENSQSIGPRSTGPLGSADKHGNSPSSVRDGESAQKWFGRQSNSMKALVVVGVFMALTSVVPFALGILRTIGYNVIGR